jgi:hypothetical protein
LAFEGHRGSAAQAHLSHFAGRTGRLRHQFREQQRCLPGVVPVRKSAEVDLIAQLRSVGAQDILENWKASPSARAWPTARHLVLVGSDNDYSVTQTGAGEQFEVCVNRSTGARVSNIPLDGRCPADMERIPGFLLAFAVDFRD